MPATAEAVWRSLGEGEVFITRENGKPFVFATGQEATLKADAERLFKRRKTCERLLGIYGAHPCVLAADAVSFVPNGPADFTEKLRWRLEKPIIRLDKPEGGSTMDMRFLSPDEIDTARQVGSVCLVEDISRTGFSASVAAGLLRSVNPGLDIHTLSLLQRDEVDPMYEEGDNSVVYHTFVRQDLPLSVEEFRRQFPELPVYIVA